MTAKTPLPNSCADCSYFRSSDKGMGTCFRHAPATGIEPFEVVHWPEVSRTQRCGVGAEIGDGTGPGVVACARCLHWWQPDGKPLHPEFRGGLPAEWWQQSGYCTRYAPSPSTEQRKPTQWRVTHARQGCGDGEDIPDLEPSEINESRLLPAPI